MQTLLDKQIQPLDSQGILFDFSPEDTFFCGQTFLWKKTEQTTFLGVADGKICEVSQEGAHYRWKSLSQGDFQDFWEHYFDCARPYRRIREQFSHNKILRHAVAFAPGLRLLRQPPFETLCCFIISQNNNIKRINGIVERLCEAFGEPLTCQKYPNQPLYVFPTPQRLAACTLEDLSCLRAGFRAKYLLDAAQKVASGAVSLENLDTLPLEDARTMLTSIFGVGVKVADCTLLFSTGRMDTFPLDVWMKRVMEHWFPKGLPKTYQPLAGLAQQYLFHYARCCQHFPPSVPDFKNIQT